MVKGEGGPTRGKGSPGSFKGGQVSLGESGRVQKVLGLSERFQEELGGYRRFWKSQRGSGWVQNPGRSGRVNEGSGGFQEGSRRVQECPGWFNMVGVGRVRFQKGP